MTLEQYKTDVLPLKDKFYRYALSIIQDVETAEDIVQEVLIKLWEQRKKLLEINRIEPWGIRMTRNLTIDKLRKRNRRFVELDSVKERTYDGTMSEGGAEHNDLIRVVGQILETLPAKQKEVFKLRELMGYRNFEIQELLNLSETDVKVSLFRARQKVRTELSKMMNYGLERN